MRSLPVALLLWASVAPAAGPDCDILWGEVLHDSFRTEHRAPGGAVPAGSAPVRLRLRTAADDLTAARVRVWNDRTNNEVWLPMTPEPAPDPDHDLWTVDLPVPPVPTLLWYFFELTDDGTGGDCTGSGGRADRDYYVDDDPKLRGGGPGVMVDDIDLLRSFQITVYDPAFDVPEWLQRATVYQVFPDRFRNGDPANDPQAGTGFLYGATYLRPDDWNRPVCDPRDASGPCPGGWNREYYGGDLRGLTDKIEEGFFDELGVTALYLNPIFRAPSNHRYDTADYFEIDPILGTEADFLDLVEAAGARGLRLILDGVFNHTSSDSPYFDFYSRWDAAGTLTSPDGPGVDDDSGACEAFASPFYGWYYFPDVGDPAGGGLDLCANGPDDDLQTYDAWSGLGTLPRLRSGDDGVRGFLFADGLDSVVPAWTAKGADGWRLDAPGQVDCGLLCDDGSDFWEALRSALRSVAPDAVLVGEEWGDASFWLLGEEWDSAMNYRFHGAALGWLASNPFEDNDHNASSPLGSILPLAPSGLDGRLRSIHEDYPPAAFRAMLNLSGSHDLNRLRFLLRKANGDDDDAARARLRQYFLLAFTYAGAPTLYYGDEIGLSQDGVLDAGVWQDDPYNRAPYPWPDTPGAFRPDPALRDQVVALSALRSAHRVLQDGDVQHGLVVDDARDLYGFARTGDGVTALVLLNKGAAGRAAVFSGLGAPPLDLADGTVLEDVLNGGTTTVSAGAVEVRAPGGWGAVLLPAPAPDLAVSGSCPGETILSISGASPGGEVAIAAGTTPGAFAIPAGPCAGAALAIADPRLLGRVAADAAGAAELRPGLPGFACGGLVQVVDLTRCTTSGAVSLP